MTTDKNSIKEFYDEVYKKGDIRDNCRLYRRIMALINPHFSGRLLDVGCGVGCLLYEASKKNASIYGLDISLQALSKATEIMPFAKVCVGDGEQIPFKDNSFDNVVSLGSLEHFLRPESGIREISRVVKNKGRVVLLLPNSFFLGDILKVLLQGKGPDQWQIHERLLSREQWRLLIEENGMAVEKIYGYNKYPELFQEGTFKIKSIKKYIRAFLLKHLCPLNLSWQFVYVCRKSNN